MLAVRARALLDGAMRPRSMTWWNWPSPVLKHRMALTFAARATARPFRPSSQAQVAHRIADGRRTRGIEAEASDARPAQAPASVTMPRLIPGAPVAATVIHGLHGRRRAGTGENF